MDKKFQPLGADFGRQAKLNAQLYKTPYTKPIRSPINVGQADGSVQVRPQVTHRAPPAQPAQPSRRPIGDAGSQGGFNRATKNGVTAKHSDSSKSPKEAANDKVLAEQIAKEKLLARAKKK